MSMTGISDVVAGWVRFLLQRAYAFRLVWATSVLSVAVSGNIIP